MRVQGLATRHEPLIALHSSTVQGSLAHKKQPPSLRTTKVQIGELFRSNAHQIGEPKDREEACLAADPAFVGELAVGS